MNTHGVCFHREIRKITTVEMFEHFFLLSTFQDTLKRKAEYLAHGDNIDNPERKRQKNGISANEHLGK